jgi:predicted CXXCH cytochrome family protein
MICPRGILESRLAALAAALLLLAGCDRRDQEPPARTGDVPGASMVHLTDEPESASAKTIKAMGWPVVPAAPRPTRSLPQGSSCVTPECHATLVRQPQVHLPVSSGACDACHESDIGGHRYPLKRQANETCSFCHTVAGTLAHQHKALEQGCISCHRPHASQAKFLLRADSVERVCAACHDVPLKRFTHAPVASGDCTGCHLPHQAGNRNLLRRGEGPQHCMMCHDDVRTALAVVNHIHEPVGRDCLACHTPHSSDHRHELKKPMGELCLDCHQDVKQKMADAPRVHSAMLTDRQCGNCHAAHGSNEPMLLRQRADRVCMTCHDKALTAADGRTVRSMTPQLREASFLHGPIAAGQCTPCHDAHGGQHAALLRKPFPSSFYTRFDLKHYELCFECHESALVTSRETRDLTGFRNGETNLHYTHVHRDEKGRTCRTCHAIHGSNLPNHMASEVPFERSRWSMPIRFEKTADGGTCTPGCHGPSTYDRNRPATDPAPRGGK